MSPTNGLGTSLRSTRSKYIQTTWQIVRAPQDAASSIQNNRVGLGLAFAFTRKTSVVDKMRRNSMTSLSRVSEYERGTKTVAAICPNTKKTTWAAHNFK